MKNSKSGKGKLIQKQYKQIYHAYDFIVLGHMRGVEFVES